MPHILDLQPTEDLDMPHQLLAYKGHPYHNARELVNRHSESISPQAIESEVMTVDYYKRETAGRLAPDEVIDFMRSFLNFSPVADMSALGEFGGKLIEHRQILEMIQISPFDYIYSHTNRISMSLEVLYNLLINKKILCKAEKRGRKEAISFYGLPCPCCKKTTSNARAYPPSYVLHCFNTNCEAYHGVPLYKWAGVKGNNGTKRPSIRLDPPDSPGKYEDMGAIESIVQEELANSDNSLLLFTPGVGKTHEALKHLKTQADNKVILYSCLNKKLQTEAYEKILGFPGISNNIHLLKAKDELCARKSELLEVTRMGFSPSEVLCSRCEFKDQCEYYKQREIIENGIYFVTHHMLQYLTRLIPEPDLIVLDENLVQGFLLEDECDESQMKTLSIVLGGADYALVERILDLANNLYIGVLRSDTHKNMIVNGKRLSLSDTAEDSLISILSRQMNLSGNQFRERISVILSKLGSLSQRELYEKGVNLNAIHWLKGLISDRHYSYLSISKKDAALFAVKYLTPLGYSSTPLKILDATGNREIAERLTQRKIKLVRVDVDWKSHRIHIHNNTSRSTLRFTKDSDLRRILEMALKEMSATNILLVTYKFLKERVKRLCETIDPTKEYKLFHFSGSRGINEYEDCDGVILLGLPYSNLDSSWQDAHILFPHKRDEALRESWVDLCMNRELIQVIHRIRPVKKNPLRLSLSPPFGLPYCWSLKRSLIYPGMQPGKSLPSTNWNLSLKSSDS